MERIEKMRKIEHIGIAVKDLEKSNQLFASLFGEKHYKTEEVLSEGVKTSFFKSGPNKIELLEATNPESPIAKFIAKKGEGIHHIAFAVTDIKAEIINIDELITKRDSLQDRLSNIYKGSPRTINKAYK